MRKRIFAAILILVMTLSTLVGCSFFSHDDERDMQQEVASVQSYTIASTVNDDQGVGTDHTFVTEKKTIYKRDLLEYVQNNASSLSSSFANDVKGLYEYAVRMLINVEIVANEVDALIENGQVKWGVAEQNAVKKGLYDVIDNTLVSIKNEILAERDLPEITVDSDDAADAETTYPVKPDATDEDDSGLDIEPEPWQPDRVNYPGIGSDSDTRSLEREAVKRFVALIKSRVDGDFRLDKPERRWLKTKIDEEIRAIDELIDTQGIEAVYPVIGSYGYPMKDYDGKFGYIMYYISGEALERSQKITAMQNYLTDSVTVQYDEVAASYTTQLNEQKSRYAADPAAYDSDMSGGSATVLYNANSNYFYVKHILLPFSDEQTAALTAYKARPEIANLQIDEMNERVNAYRERLADAIVCYPHKDGENDTSRPMSVDDVLSHVRSVMTPLKGNVKSANDAFNDLIYLYNTDPGAFGNDKGYVVKYRLNEGENETYMQEFADASRVMRRELEVGEFYDHKVITDYGVHIMYLASVPQVGEVRLTDYTSPDRSQTYYDLLEEPIRTQREQAVFTNWQNNILTYNYNRYSKTYTSNYSDLWGD